MLRSIAVAHLNPWSFCKSSLILGSGCGLRTKYSLSLRKSVSIFSVFDLFFLSLPKPLPLHPSKVLRTCFLRYCAAFCWDALWRLPEGSNTFHHAPDGIFCSAYKLPCACFRFWNGLCRVCAFSRHFCLLWADRSIRASCIFLCLCAPCEDGYPSHTSLRASRGTCSTDRGTSSRGRCWP